MKALLLAAGEGTRLRPLTNETPKAMVPVGDVPVLERNVRWLEAQGIDELAINLHHLPDVITGHFGDGSKLGVRIRWSHEPELLGTAGALIPLVDWFADERFVVVYGDNLIDCDLGRMLAAHERAAAEVTVALWEREDTRASGVAELDGVRITRFIEKPRPGESDSRWVSAGLLVCEPSVFALIGDDPPVDFGRDVLPTVLESGRLAGYAMTPPDERLDWIDTPADLARAERALVENPLP
jgi:NDP-sugar pyrophosphorylase family protein